ncbi:MAG: ABC transporter ATP-binding protein [Nocardiopsaceae bacterium]|nr:ABC transporter ATP-binding protein [Nocardiopsaceae bacterium]
MTSTASPSIGEAGGADVPLLEINGLTVSIGSGPNALTAVRGIDLTLRRGESLGVVGESGAGKSLSMLSVTSLLPKNARLGGSVKLKGVELVGLGNRELRKIRGADVGMIFQDPMTSLNPVFTVGRQVGEAIKIHNPGMSRKAVEAAAIELLASVAIPSPKERISSYPFELSGGMRQRVMIAIAIANNPALLIADEPTTALDVTIQAQILRLLQRLAEERDMALVLITHDLGVIAGMVDRVAVMYAGRIVEERNTADLFADPRHPYTKALLACIPRPDETNLRIAGIPGSPAVLRPAPRGCAFAPRCSDVIADCKEIDPQLEGQGDERVACIVAAPPGSTSAASTTEGTK